MEICELIQPVLKWAGGKRQLLNDLTPLFPDRITTYCEPFLGGGAVLFALQPEKAIVNDINSDLIELYGVIRDNVEGLIEELSKHLNEEAYFYEVRSWDRDKDFYQGLSPVQRAARMLYLNKTCYNGLFRVNRRNEFNVPFGHYKNPVIINIPVLKAVSRYFNEAEVTFYNKPYYEVLKDAAEGTFVYLDPPYDPVSETGSFTSYTKDGFDRSDQIRLRQMCDELHERGIRFMLSNSATNFIKEQYSTYHIIELKAKRAINSKGTKRGPVSEVVIRNYT